MKRLFIILLVTLLAGCHSIVKMEGDQVIGDRLSVKLAPAWNQMPKIVATPFTVLTREGTSVDQLRVWVGIKPGGALANPPPRRPGDQSNANAPVFTEGLSEEQLARLFEVAYAIDDSIVRVTKLEPSTFAGARGLRMEFTVSGKTDHVIRQGIVWMSVQRGELSALAFTAPRLGFFPRMRADVEAIARSAALKP